MEPKWGDSSRILLAPSSGGGAVMTFPSADRTPRRLRSPSSSSSFEGVSFPSVDDHIVRSEVTRDEVIDGRKVIAAPALEPHGDAHAELGGVVRWQIREGYRPSVDLLTRVNEGSDFATDLSIRKDGIDPATGHRYLEELSFEIVNEQSLRDICQKARALTARGVRRVFAIFVKSGEVSEWSAEKNDFVALDKNGMLEDPCFLRPMAVRGLFDTAVAEWEVVAALEKKRSPALLAVQERAERKGHDAGILDGSRRTLSKILQAKFGELPAAALSRIKAADADSLERWADSLLHANTLADVLI